MLSFLTRHLLFLFFAGFLFAEEIRPKDRLIVETLIRLKRFDVSENEKWKAAVERYARSERGEEGYFELVEQFSIKSELPELLGLIQENTPRDQAAKAVQVVLALGEQEELLKLLLAVPNKKAEAMVTLLGFVKTPRAEKLLEKYNTINQPATTVVKGAPAPNE